MGDEAREARYAVAIFVDDPCSKPWKWESCHTHSDDWVPGREGLCGYALDSALRVMAVADAEIAAALEAAALDLRAFE